MELENFPFDMQNLTVEIQSLWELSHPDTPVALVKQQNDEFPSMCNNLNKVFMQSSEYDLYDRLRFDQALTAAAESSSRVVSARVGMRVAQGSRRDGVHQGWGGHGRRPRQGPPARARTRRARAGRTCT